jgi:serine protease Do
VVRLGVLREGKNRTIEIKIGELPDDALTRKVEKKRDLSTNVDNLGLNLRELDEETKSEAGVDHGVVVVDVSKGPAEEIGLRSNDIIQMLDNQKVESVAGLQKILETIKPGRSVAILVYRDTGPVFLAMRMP